jgi:hypothetical protein
MIDHGKETYYVTAYDHRNDSHDKGRFDTEREAYETAKRIKRQDGGVKYYCVCTGIESATGYRIGIGPV